MHHPHPGVRDHAPPGTERLLDGLTPEQAQAVTFGAGPLLLLAGPGAGKTRKLTHRVAYLLARGPAKAWGVLAVHFRVRRPPATRARRGVWSHRALHDLRPGRHAPSRRLAAVRRRARRDPAGA